MSHVAGVGSEEVVSQTLALLVKAAADWQASGLQRQGSNTGACLRSNFLLMADIVVSQDAHLLVDEETQLLAGFKVYPAALCMHSSPYTSSSESASRALFTPCMTLQVK